MNDEMFIEKYEELLDKGYCDCNEMNCLDNDVPRKILNIVKRTKLEAKQLLEENQQLKELEKDHTATLVLLNEENKNLKEQLKQKDEVIDKAIKVLGDLSTQLIMIDNSDYVYSQEEICKKVFAFQKELLDILNKGREPHEN